MAKHFKKIQTTFSAFANPKDVVQYLPNRLKGQVENIAENNEDAIKNLMKEIVKNITLDDEKRGERIYEFKIMLHPFPDAIIDKLLDAIANKAKHQFRFIESIERVSA